MATIEMTSGTLYILGPDNSYEPVGNLNEIEEAYTSEFTDESSYISMTNLSESFEAICKLSKEAAIAIAGLHRVIMECCPNRRVVRLALYSKKPRTRKKNFNRAIRILEDLK